MGTSLRSAYGDQSIGASDLLPEVSDMTIPEQRLYHAVDTTKTKCDDILLVLRRKLPDVIYTAEMGLYGDNVWRHSYFRCAWDQDMNGWDWSGTAMLQSDRKYFQYYKKTPPENLEALAQKHMMLVENSAFKINFPEIRQLVSKVQEICDNAELVQKEKLDQSRAQLALARLNREFKDIAVWLEPCTCEDCAYISQHLSQMGANQAIGCMGICELREKCDIVKFVLDNGFGSTKDLGEVLRQSEDSFTGDDYRVDYHMGHPTWPLDGDSGFWGKIFRDITLRSAWRP